ncbi:MAG: glycosyltransferase [Clostridiales bacterium]|nr:glycosyltransferase [Clostridiales bacterium]
MPTVSILMGIYNEKKIEQVKQAIDSILNQTFGDFEFLICDDGSKLEFYEWLQEYCEKDERIQLLRKEKNEGLAAALNTCFENAKGTYIARMDADDISRKDRFEKQVEFLEKHSEYALVGCNADMIDENGKWGERILVEKPQKEDFLRTSPFIHPSIIIRREVLNELGGYSTAEYTKRTEDYELFMRLYAEGFRGYNMQENLFCYREDRNAYEKRKYRYRMNESRVRCQGFMRMGILIGHLRYVVKPLIVGMLPVGIMRRIRKKQFGV